MQAEGALRNLLYILKIIYLFKEENHILLCYLLFVVVTSLTIHVLSKFNFINKLPNKLTKFTRFTLDGNLVSLLCSLYGKFNFDRTQ